MEQVNVATPEASVEITKEILAKQKAEIAAKAAEITNAIVAAKPGAISLKPVVFHFKKEKLRNEKGEVIGEGTKRESLEISLPVPTIEEIISLGEKSIALLMDAVLDTIYTQGREILNEDSERKLNAANFPYEKLSWEYIANLPPSEKRGGGISKETWDAFYEDYVEVMCAVTGKEKSRVTKAADIFKGRLQSIRSRKDVLAAMREFLQIWFLNSKQQEEFADVFKFLDGKAEVFLKEDDAALLEAL